MISRLQVRMLVGVSWRIFFSRINGLCWLWLGICSTPVLLQWHVKDPDHSAKSAGGRLHLNTHTPLTQQSWSGLTMLLSRHSVGTYQETSSHASHQGTHSHSHLNSLSHCGLILVKRVELVCASLSPLFKKKRRQGMNCRTIFQNPRTQGKSHHQGVACSRGTQKNIKYWPSALREFIFL